MRWCSRLISVRMSTRSLASRLDSGSSNRNSLRVAHQRAAHGDALALAAGELARLAVEQVVDLQQLRRPRAIAFVALRLRHAAHLHAEGDVLARPSCSGRARRTGTPWRCRASTGCRSLIVARRRSRISPAVIVSSPAIMLSSVDLPQPDGPTRTRNSPFSSSRSMPLQDLDRAEALLERRRFREMPWIYPLTAPAIRPRTK